MADAIPFVMDALDMLKNDHDKIRHVLQDLKTVSGRDQKPLLDQIENRVEGLFFVEETILYSHFRDYAGFGAAIARAQSQHRIVRGLFEKLNSERAGGIPGADLELLMRELEHHMRVEESELFPLVRHEMKRPEREKLGRVMQAAKDEKKIAA